MRKSFLGKDYLEYADNLISKQAVRTRNVNANLQLIPVENKVNSLEDGCYFLLQLVKNLDVSQAQVKKALICLKQRGTIKQGIDYKKTYKTNRHIYFESTLKKLKEYFKEKSYEKIL